LRAAMMGSRSRRPSRVSIPRSAQKVSRDEECVSFQRQRKEIQCFGQGLTPEKEGSNDRLFGVFEINAVRVFGPECAYRQN